MSSPSPYYGKPNQPAQTRNSQIKNEEQQARNSVGLISMGARARANNLNNAARDQEIINNQQFLPDNGKSPGDLYESSRAGFVRKVYSILSIQLIITTLICLCAMKTEFFKTAFVNTPAIITVSVLLLVFSCVIGCWGEGMRKYGLPILIVFTLLFSILVGIICSRTKPEIVLAAAGLTAVIVIGLTIFSCVTKSDLTGCGPYLFVICLAMIVFGIVCIFWRNPIVQLLYAVLSAILFSIYLVFDTQMVLGKFTNAYSLDDAYFAALQLYIDIIQIFLQLLRILSYVNN